LLQTAWWCSPALAFPPRAKFKPEELANVDAFMRNPSLVWEWYSARRKVISGVLPNPGHRAIVEMERIFGSVTVITQNIDNLHRRAGSTRVFELHGNIERNYCTKCGMHYRDPNIALQEGRPLCRRMMTSPLGERECGGLIRPDVVWFGELLPADEWSGAVRAVEAADVFFSVGTSGVVYPAASLPLKAKEEGVFVVEINPEATPLSSHADEFLQGPAGEILPALVLQISTLRRLGKEGKQ
jgi:NAD-dependent deacetylase